MAFIQPRPCMDEAGAPGEKAVGGGSQGGRERTPGQRQDRWSAIASGEWRTETGTCAASSACPHTRARSRSQQNTPEQPALLSPAAADAMQAAAVCGQPVVGRRPAVARSSSSSRRRCSVQAAKRLNVQAVRRTLVVGANWRAGLGRRPLTDRRCLPAPPLLPPTTDRLRLCAAAGHPRAIG